MTEERNRKATPGCTGVTSGRVFSAVSQQFPPPSKDLPDSRPPWIKQPGGFHAITESNRTKRSQTSTTAKRKETDAGRTHHFLQTRHRLIPCLPRIKRPACPGIGSTNRGVCRVCRGVCVGLEWKQSFWGGVCFWAEWKIPSCHNLWEVQVCVSPWPPAAE